MTNYISFSPGTPNLPCHGSEGCSFGICRSPSQESHLQADGWETGFCIHCTIWPECMYSIYKAIISYFIYLSLNVWDYIYIMIKWSIILWFILIQKLQHLYIYRYRYICIQCPDQGIGEELEEEETWSWARDRGLRLLKSLWTVAWVYIDMCDNTHVVVGNMHVQVYVRPVFESHHGRVGVLTSCALDRIDAP